MSDGSTKPPLSLVVLASIAVLASALVVTNMMHSFDTSIGAGILGAGALVGLGLASRRRAA